MIKRGHDRMPTSSSWVGRYIHAYHPIQLNSKLIFKIGQNCENLAKPIELSRIGRYNRAFRMLVLWLSACVCVDIVSSDLLYIMNA